MAACLLTVTSKGDEICTVAISANGTDSRLFPPTVPLTANVKQLQQY